MKKILSILAVAWLSVVTCAAQSEWTEIVFTAATPAGTDNFNDSVFVIPGSEFYMICKNDVGKKFCTRQQTSSFGTLENNQVYNYSLKTGSSLNYLEFNIPADGIFRIAVRSSNSEDETRTVYVVQDGDTIFARAPKESEKVESIYPYFTTYVRKGTIRVYDPNVAYFGFAFKEETIPDDPMDVENTENPVRAVKSLRNGQIYIFRGDKTYTLQGQDVK